MSGRYKLILLILLIWISVRLFNNYLDPREQTEPVSTEELESMIKQFEEDNETKIQNTFNE